MTELAISTNMSIADVREPDKRNSSYTKTITIPMDGEAKRLFENIFQVNSTLTSFNPNIKTPAKYYVNEVLVFDGSLQLLKINNTFVNDYTSSEAECSLIGNSGNLFLDIAGLYLTDINLVDLDHTFTYTGTMFAPAVLGEGYGYPYIDYGTQVGGLIQSNTWDFRYLKPALFEKEYVNRIFSTAGYTIASGGYFDSAYAERIIIPDVNQGQLKMATSDRLNNECYIGITPAYNSIAVSGTYFSGAPGTNTGFVYYNFTNNIISPIPFNNETAPYSDINARWDAVTNYRFTVNDRSYYNLYVNLEFDLVLDTYPATSVTWRPGNTNVYSVFALFEKSTDGGTSWTALGSLNNTFTFNQNVATPTVSSVMSGSVNNILLDSGDLVRVAFRQGVYQMIAFYDVGVNEVSAGTSTIHFRINPNSSFKANVADLQLIEGRNVDMNSTIPQNITQLDFLTSIIKSENLYLDLSTTIKDQYIIKTRDEYLDLSVANSLDWTDKWDISRKQEIIPMGELDFNTLKLSYKSDKDHFNKVYEDKYKEVYGAELININNDFVKKTKNIDVVFSATPIAGTTSNDIVAARFFEKDETTNIVSPIKCNIRRLYWGGLKSCDTHTFISAGVSSIVNTYPFAGHVDDPINPTIDLSFDNPFELNWYFPGRTYTDNNRYNDRYSKFFTEITDPNSKIVRMWMYLTETDIASFSFSKLVYIRDTYYLVNKIIDYNPQVKTVTQVEFLKLKAGSVFVPDNDFDIDYIGDESVGITARTSNNNNGTGILLGDGNFNNGVASFIVGDNNTIA